MLYCTSKVYLERKVKLYFCVFWFILLLFMLALSILSLVYGFKDTRRVSIDKYSERISEWESTKRLEFLNLDIRVADSLNNDIHLAKQEQDPSMVKKDSYTKIQEYTPTFYSYSKLKPREFNESEVLTVNFSIYVNGTYSNSMVQEIQALKKHEISVLRADCKSLGGQYSLLANCLLALRLSKVCVKVKKSEKWELDLTDDRASCKSHGGIGEYKIDKKEDLGDLTYEVRSSYDPLIYAQELTDDSLDFGLPGLIWKVMGFIFLIISLFLISQPTIYFKQRVYGELKESPNLVEFQPRKPDIHNNLN